MKAANFRNFRVVGATKYADIDVPTSWRRTKTITVFMPEHSSIWRDLETGKYLSGLDDMHTAAIARKQLEDAEIEFKRDAICALYQGLKI